MQELVYFVRKLKKEPDNLLTFGIMADYLEENGFPYFFLHYLEDCYFREVLPGSVELWLPPKYDIKVMASSIQIEGQYPNRHLSRSVIHYRIKPDNITQIYNTTLTTNDKDPKLVIVELYLDLFLSSLKDWLLKQ